MCCEDWIHRNTPRSHASNGPIARNLIARNPIDTNVMAVRWGEDPAALGIAAGSTFTLDDDPTVFEFVDFTLVAGEPALAISAPYETYKGAQVIYITL